MSGGLANLPDDEIHRAVRKLPRGNLVVTGTAGRAFVADAGHEGDDESGKQEKHRQDDDQGNGSFLLEDGCFFHGSRLR